MRTLALLLAAAIAAPVVADAATPNGNTRNAAPLVRQQRLLGAPRSTKVHFTLRGRTVTTTVGALLDAHRALAASFSQAAAHGRTVAGSLDGSTPVVVGAPGTHPTTPPGLVIHAAGLNPAIKRARSGVLAVREDTGKFATLPADARAFCTAAKATACVYVPQTASMTEYQNEFGIMDIQVDPTGCAARGGNYTYQVPTPSPDEHYQLWGWCTYTYPRADKTTFSPVSKVYVQQTCTDPLFRRNVRTSVVSIRVNDVPAGSSDFSPHWCAIRVAVDLRAGTQHGRPPPLTRPKRT